MSTTSDSQKPKRSRLAVPADDFVRYLEAKTQGQTCPACGHDDWTLVCPSDEEADAYRLVTVLKDGDRPMNISTFAIYCDHCGFLRQHLARKVRDWALQNPIEQELDLGIPDAPDQKA